MKTLLNIADTHSGITNLGPGKRFGIWVQGCPFNCKNCLTPYWIPFRVNRPTLIERLADKIIKDKDIDGITISGGEPFVQAQQLTVLLEMVTVERPELNTIVFTGFKKNRLYWDDALSFLKHIDILIDGLYVEDLNSGVGMKGSDNQTIHYLSERANEFKSYFENYKRTIEEHKIIDGIAFVGIPNHSK